MNLLLRRLLTTCHDKYQHQCERWYRPRFHDLDKLRGIVMVVRKHF
jgi:hypothetical protein